MEMGWEGRDSARGDESIVALASSTSTVEVRKQGVVVFTPVAGVTGGVRGLAMVCIVVHVFGAEINEDAILLWMEHI